MPRRPPPEGELSPVMVVLDSSGSMTARDAGGSGTRMDAAKRAVGSMVDGLPAQAPVGLTIYGAGTGSSGAEKAAGCRTSGSSSRSRRSTSPPSRAR